MSALRLALALALLSFGLCDGRQGRRFEVTEVKAALEVIRPKLQGNIHRVDPKFAS